MTEMSILLVVTALVNQAVIPGADGPARDGAAWDTTVRMKRACGLGVMVIGVLTAVCALTGLLDTWIFIPFGLDYLRVLTLAVVTVCVCLAAERIVMSGAPDAFPYAGESFGLLTGNCIVLGTAVWVTQQSQTFAQSVVSGFATGVAFTVVGVLFAAIRGRIADEDLPAPVRGIPILLLSGALISIALLGLNMLA